jgi:hypothetical protein
VSRICNSPRHSSVRVTVYDDFAWRRGTIFDSMAR